MHDLAALEQHTWVCWHYLFDGHGYHGLVKHGTMIWFTDLPSWGTYLSPHATGRLWSCSTFDWPKRCRDSGLKHCGRCENLLGIASVWSTDLGTVMVFCLTLASCDESTSRNVKMCHALPGCNMRRIAECTGAKVRIRGQGSNSKRQKWKIRSSFKLLLIETNPAPVEFL